MQANTVNQLPLTLPKPGGGDEPCQGVVFQKELLLRPFS